MLKRSLQCCALAAMFIGIAQVEAEVISVGTFNPPNTNFNAMAAGFDAQPTSDPVAGETSTMTGNSIGGLFGTDPAYGLDFGADFATKTFTDVYMLQGNFQTANAVMDYYWSTDQIFDGGDVAAPNLNLFNYGNYSNANEGRWELVFSDAGGVTPSARYMFIYPNSGTRGNFAFEVAFVNAQQVPEPRSFAVWSLLGALGLAFGISQRRSRKAE